MKARDIKLDLQALCDGIPPGLSRVGGAAMAEAAGVCLDDRGHPRECSLTIEGRWNTASPLRFGVVDDQMRATWNDREEATEQGAYGVALLLLSKIDGYRVIERSRKGPGFDYWLGKGGAKANGKAEASRKRRKADGQLFQEKLRLEVSGIRSGNETAIAGRIRTKVTQVTRKPSSFPALVAVVEYSRPLARVVSP